MDKSNEGLKEESTGGSHNREILLIISIDKKGKIVQFNKECEKITGYKRYEVLNKEFFDFLIPENYFEQWKRMFDSASRDEVINDLKLPWLTRQGQEIMVSWSSFPIEEVEGEIEDICLIGKLIIPDSDAKEPLLEQITEEAEDKESVIEFIKDGIENDEADVVNKIDRDMEDETVFTLGNKRVIFKKSSSTSPRETVDTGKEKIPSRKKVKKKPTKTKPVKTRPVKTVEEKKIDESYKPSVESYHGLDKIIKDLEKKNKQLEKENKKLEKNLKSLKTRLPNLKKDKKSQTSTVFGSLKGKRKQEEFEDMIHELDERKSLLDNLEAQLTKEKENIDQQRQEFFKWREKLESLEDEIESRRKELVEQEKIFSDRFVSSSDEGISESAGIDSESASDVETKKETIEKHEILYKISEGAAIVQRGILKQVNRPFVELLGYNMEEILEKSLLDFVVQEGFSGIEKYYLNRLKGEAVSSFETVFLTKDENRLAVEISIRPIVFNGEKADIAVFNKVTGAQEASAVDELEEKPAEPSVEEPLPEPEITEEPLKEQSTEEVPEPEALGEPPKEEKPTEEEPKKETPEPEHKEETTAEEASKEDVPEPELPKKETKEEASEPEKPEKPPTEEKAEKPPKEEEKPAEEPEPPEEEGTEEKSNNKSKETK
jgi:PAS domain S-box-containing protein